MPDSTLTEALARHRAFWQRTPVDRPLLSIRPWQAYTFYPPFPRADGSPLPERTTLAPDLVSAARYWELTRPAGLFDGDFICPAVPYDACWMEAMLGCRVVAASGTTWAEPFLPSWDEARRLAGAQAGTWLDELVGAFHSLAEAAGPDHPIGQPLLRGPSDMALAALGSQLFGTGFYDHPDEMQALLSTCARLRLEAANRRLAAAPPFHGGYCSRDAWGLWAPGALLDFQEDAAGLLSARTYREFVAPVDHGLIQQFEYSLLHVHSGQLQMLTAMLEIPELSAIQVAIDPPPYAPAAGALLPRFKEIQAAGKSLLVTGPMRQPELDEARRELSPVGLALRIGILSENDGLAYLKQSFA